MGCRPLRVGLQAQRKIQRFQTVASSRMRQTDVLLKTKRECGIECEKTMCDKATTTKWKRVLYCFPRKRSWNGIICIYQAQRRALSSGKLSPSTIQDSDRCLNKCEQNPWYRPTNRHFNTVTTNAAVFLLVFEILKGLFECSNISLVVL